MNKMYCCRAYLFCTHELLGLSIPQIAEECGVSYTTIRDWIKDKYKKERKKCNFCNNNIKYNKIDNVVKIFNIEQDPHILYFCCKECKISRIKKIQEEVKE